MSPDHTMPPQNSSVRTEMSSVICEPLSEKAAEPCSIIIFGASGDLVSRKLVPALWTLHRSNSLPEPVTIVGASRTRFSDDAFRDHLRERIEQEDDGVFDVAGWEDFASCIFYRQAEYDDETSLAALSQDLQVLDKQRSTMGNRIFYCAVPPTIYPVLGRMLGAVGLSVEGSPDWPGWSRIVVEKPFGRDLASALELDQIMHQGFAEHQIYRIDHYLAKETVQNILMLRFANAIFEPVWNRGYIDYIGILATEKLGVEHRAGYYEQAGVIRDMFQNHMMQLLALTAMEPPSVFEAARVQDEKVKVFRSLKPFSEASPEENLILGQYGAGRIDGKSVAGYRDEPDVSADSTIPTFAMLRLFVDNWRWRGVPFYLASGKRLAEKSTRIVVQFKGVPHSMFRHVLGERIHANRLTMGVFPREEITLTFQAKNPGAKFCMQTVTMDFVYQKQGPSLDAYAKGLLDCIEGDHMLFWRQDGVEQTWTYLDPILVECESCSARAALLHQYPAGSKGPLAAAAWMDLILGK